MSQVIPVWCDKATERNQSRSLDGVDDPVTFHVTVSRLGPKPPHYLQNSQPQRPQPVNPLMFPPAASP